MKSVLTSHKIPVLNFFLNNEERPDRAVGLHRTAMNLSHWSRSWLLKYCWRKKDLISIVEIHSLSVT